MYCSLLIIYFEPSMLFSLLKAVRDNVHKAFWDSLESELNDDPPEYGQAIRLLEEIRGVSSHSLFSVKSSTFFF